jgi:hypothetical protein
MPKPESPMQVQKVGNINLTYHTTPAERSPFKFSGDNPGDVMGQFKAYGLFDLNFFSIVYG